MISYHPRNPKKLHMNISKHITKAIYNSLLFFIVCTLLFAALEIFLRVYQPFEFRVKGDKIILPVNRKYVMNNSIMDKLDKRIVHTKNALGFRGKNPPKEFSKALTIISVGGSTTECFSISDRKTWTDVLGERLKNSFNNVWINNAGMDGQSTFGHIILMEDHIIKLKPKVVLFLIGLNDAAAESYNQYDKKMLLHERKIRDIESAVMFLADRSDVISGALNMYRWFKAYKIGLPRYVPDYSKLKSIDWPETAKAEYRYEMNKVNRQPFEERLMRIIQLSRENGIIPVFITQPALFGEGIDDITGRDLAKMEAFEGVPGELIWESLELTNDVIRQVGKREGEFVINLSEYLPKSSKYYIDLVHFSNEGNERVGDIIYKKICPYLTKQFSGYSTKECSD